MGALAPGQIARRDGALIDYLEPLLRQRGSTLDHAQSAALDRLQSLCDELAAFKVARQSTLKRLLSPPDVPRGVYLHGGVGRGKSFLMDSAYAVVPLRRKTRVHFHAFMRDVHQALAARKREEDPLAGVARDVARRYRLIAFDEFHVADIADAMILGRLLTGLFEHGVVFVMTSNFRPDTLYPNGLKRENFLSTIDLLNERLDVVDIGEGVDYRLRALEQASAYYTPADERAEAAMWNMFDAMTTAGDEAPTLVVEGRKIVAKRRAGSAVWFDFTTLCDGPRSQRDYLELARRFAVMLVSNVPQMDHARSDAARRFTWLVDILYDHRVKLVLSAAVPAESLYREGPSAHEFPRTVSRLVEMRSRDYMSLPHVSAA
ncbi:MAG TPA: cell division protein ZapE [Casimicrobiaceae bacterium]|nr:cell division protein ZapE [Casimicrobiaceae bacterium]